MELSEENVNFVKFSKVALDIVPRCLRKCFLRQWNEKFPTQKWQSDSKSGTILFNALPMTVKCTKNKMQVKCIEKMRTGNEGTWDTTVLGFAMLDAGLKLIDENKPEEKEIREGISMIREIRNTCFGHQPEMSISFAAFSKAIGDLKSLPGNIINEDARKEIDEIANSKIKEKMTVQQMQQLKEEMKFQNVYESTLSEVKHDVKKLKHEVEKLRVTYHEPQPYNKKNIDDLKDKYKGLYQKHQIHIAEGNGKISLKEVNIVDFAVKLKIHNYSLPKDTFREEAKRHLDNLRNTTSDDIDLSQLLDDNNRVTFVRGIAGMGKTILSKQLLCLWSQSKIYNSVRVCIMFECREINVFQATRGAHLQQHEILEEFVKTKFQFDLDDGTGVLFVIDGLDELYDIRTDNSIIKQLLSRSIYPACKVIVTGRPHIESKVDECGEIGGLQKVEIQGLDEEQIKEYVAKFPFPEGVCIDLNSAKDSSKSFIPILHIPQFLNTFCCVASLLKGESVRSGAELYCWTIYLLLKQHANRENPSKVKLISDIFREYSKELLTLGEVCHKLLNENKLIISKNDIRSLLVDFESSNDFMSSLFVDVSNNFERKLQFKHLTLMEFLSAFHICCNQNPMDIITNYLKNGFIEVVIFACQLISGVNSRGIIQEMLKVNSARLMQLNRSAFCNAVLVALKECKLDEKTAFLSSLDIVVSCLKEDATDKSSVISAVQMLSTESVQTQIIVSKRWRKGINLSVEKSKKLYAIYKHLLHICKCNDDDLRVAFNHIHVFWFEVSELDMVKCVKYFGYIFGIALHEMRLDVNAAHREMEAIGYAKCKAANMYKCDLEDKEIERQSCGSNLNWVGMYKCRLKNINSLINSFHWATTSSTPSSSNKSFTLRGLKLEDGWWTDLVVAIEKEKTINEHVNLHWLAIIDCTPSMRKDLQRKILQCGVKLAIDGKWV